jgi:hypothetical protein
MSKSNRVSHEMSRKSRVNADSSTRASIVRGRGRCRVCNATARIIEYQKTAILHCVEILR